MSSKCLSVLLTLLLISNCNGIPVNYAIEEEKGPDYYLGKISDGANLRSSPEITSDAEFESLRYNLLSSGNPDAQFFTVNERTSDLYTTKTIDRDELCRFSDTCILQFEVAADTSASDFFTKINIIVNILDINDNEPSFPSEVVNLSLSEATVLGTSAWKEGADDRDHGTFSVQQYQLLPTDTPFAIETEFYADGRTQVTLKVNQNLDREINSSFTLTIMAVDGGLPPKSGSVTINVQINDINDNAPKFAKSIYNITINEDLPENTVILKVHADDQDEGSNGEVIYKLSTLQSADIFRLFRIDLQTGDIRITQSLTQEESKQFKIIVEATDKAPSPLTSQAQVIVHVLDTHNTAPEVTVTTISSKINDEYVEFSENTNIGITMAIVLVTDHDSGYNGAVTCTLNDDHFYLKSEGDNEYNIVLGNSLDREINEWHEIVTTCSDAGSPRLSSSGSFRLHVLDVNDVPPVFTQVLYKINVEENGPKSVSVVQVHANDNDATAEQNVLYSLELAEDYKDIFSIDSTNGLIYVEQSLDREIYPSITFKVLATDNQPHPLTGSAMVEVTVLDVNDYDPVFTPSEFQFTVPENRPPDISVGRVLAVDADSGINAELQYTLLPMSSEAPPFRVLSNGTILTMMYFDREMTAQYTFSVMASDKGSPSRSSTAKVIVNVHDENDNPPIFIFPGKETDEIRVSYQSLPNTVIATIQAYDPDTSFNSHISYIMNGSNVLENFELNTHTGQFSVTSQLDQSDIGTYDLILTAVDDGEQEHQRSVKLVIIDKATVAASQSESEIKYFAIAVAISCITIVLSVLIVLAICLIKRKERQHHEKIAESVTTCSSLETDSEGSDIRFGDVCTRGILHKSNTNSLKRNDQSSKPNPIKKPFTTVVSVDEVIPEVISDSVEIWDWAESEYSRNTGQSLPHDLEPFSTFSSKTKQKNKVHWQASQC